MGLLKEKNILITGANRGMGKALVKASLEKGAKKIYATSRDLDKIQDFNDSRVVPVELDITDVAQIAEVAIKSKDTNVLINNAGVLSSGTILGGKWGSIEADMKVNYFGTINMMREFAPILMKNAPSRIVNFTSIVAYSPLPSIAGYSASKAALLSATYSVRTELAKKGIAVHAVNPGAIDTDMNKGSNWDMPSPYSVAKIILDKIEEGELDIIPEEIGQGFFNAWKEDPLKLAGIFHDLYHAEEHV